MNVYSTSGPMNIIRPETDFEASFLSAKVVGSKICYKVVDEINESVALNISLVDVGSSWVKLKKGVASLKILPHDFEKSSYILRVTLDALSIKNGCLPLHAASIRTRKKTIILFADSFCGKSTIMYHYCNKFSSTPIGDDHLVIKGDHIVGNSIARIRGPYSEERFIARELVIQPFSEYSIFVVRLSDKNSCDKTCESDFFQKYNYQKCVLRYFGSALIENGQEIPLSELVDIPLMASYQNRFAKFVAESNGIYFLSGSIDFILEEIGRILSKNSEIRREKLQDKIKNFQLSRSNLSLRKVSSTC